ncbi:unnamed protein product [Prunus brigantina]
MIVSSPKSILGWQGFYQMIRVILVPDLLEHCKLKYFPTGITPDGDLYDHYSSTIYLYRYCVLTYLPFYPHTKSVMNLLHTSCVAEEEYISTIMMKLSLYVEVCLSLLF